ncbi:MAG TPA: sugar kinase [Cellvibrio sp.]|nr:sugar kinase [Cellvibrio sp.]
MERMSDRNIILVHRETRLDGLIRRHNTREQAAFYLQSRGDSVADYQDEDSELKQALALAEKTLRQYGRVQRLERNFLPNFLFGPDDIVVVTGQDGLVVNTLKYLKGQPLIAINPAPQRFDGKLLPFQLNDLTAIINAVLNKRFSAKAVTLAQAHLNDGQTLLAVNDLYVGPKLPVSARYELHYRGQTEIQSSSGVIISTGLGSSGWLSSLLTGASAILGIDANPINMPWDARSLYFCVREPFPSHTTGTSLVYGKIEERDTFKLASQMAEGGIIFSDGIVDDAIEFNSGAIASIGIASVQGHLVAN